MSEVEFKPWPKIARFKSNCVTVTEKIDGTNGCLIIKGGKLAGVQSRNRMIIPTLDNMQFASWAYSNSEELAEVLGDGYHYGEWAGPGIQKNPHALSEKTFFLFNSARWSEFEFPAHLSLRTVPVIFIGPFDAGLIESCMDRVLRAAEKDGATAEGVIAYWHDTRTFQKATFKNSEGKWANV